MQGWLQRVWYGDAAGAAALEPLSWLYRAGYALRRHAHAAGWLSRTRIARPVIVVGNVTAGGTGKTPLVAWLSEQLAAHGVRVGIASRGYGVHIDAPRVVTRASDWREVGDEPLLLKRRTDATVIVCADRVAAARALVAAGVDVVVCDDGLQNLSLERDCEIAVIDAVRGFGNGRRLPAGPLREGTARLKGVDAVVLNGSPSVALTTQLRALLAVPARRMALAVEGVWPVVPGAEQRSLEAFRGQRVHAIAGIGHPARFFAELRAHGIEPIEHAFADHHAFAAHELAFDDELPILMTEKDAVRCERFASARMWYVRIAAHLEPADAAQLLQRVLSRLAPLPSAPATR
jgi:tetraacyldisaccharide 4'-kinase